MASPAYGRGLARMRTSSPAVRLAVEDAHVRKLALDQRLALLGGGRQRRPRRSDRASHDDHAALERGWILILEQVPQPRHLVLQLARAVPFAGNAGIEQRGAQIGTDRSRRRIGADAAERHRRQQELDAGEQREARPQRERDARDLQELLAVETCLLYADEVRQAVNEPRHQLAGDLDAGEIARRVVGEHGQVDRAAQAHEIVVDRLTRRRPEIRSDGEDAVGADRLRVARELHRVLDRERADVDRYRNTAGDHLDRGFGEVLALGDGQVERFALVVWPGDGGRACAHVEVEDLLEGLQVEAVVV